MVMWLAVKAPDRTNGWTGPIPVARPISESCTTSRTARIKSDLLKGYFLAILWRALISPWAIASERSKIVRSGLWDRELFSIRDICRMLSLSQSTIRRLIQQGILSDGHKVPSTKLVRWKYEEVKDLYLRIITAHAAEPQKKSSRGGDSG